MSRAIVKIKNQYLEWSSICDAPRTFGMRIDEFREYYQAEYGRSGMRDLEDRLSRVEEYGSSYHQPMSAEDVISGNRAGPDEAELTLEEIYQTYCLREPLDNWGGWIAP